MKLLKAMVIAFSIYSKIPVPQFEWKEEDMEYMMCFFPWIGGVIGLFFYGWTVLCEKLAIGNVCYALIAAAIPLMISGGFQDIWTRWTHFIRIRAGRKSWRF